MERVRTDLEAPPIRSSQMNEISGTEGSFLVDDRDSSTCRKIFGSTASLLHDACVNDQRQEGRWILHGGWSRVRISAQPRVNGPTIRSQVMPTIVCEKLFFLVQ